MSRWWRAYEDAVDDPKVQRLPGELFKAWFNLLCLASRNGGYLPAIEDISFGLRMPEKKCGEILDHLLQSGLLDEFDGRFMPHNWSGRQHQSDRSTERVKRFRERSVKRDETVSETQAVTPPDTEQNRTEKEDGAERPSEDDPDKALFARGKQVLGENSGGLIAKLKKHNGGSIPKTRAALELASTKHNPTEYVGAILRGSTDEGYRRAVGAIV